MPSKENILLKRRLAGSYASTVISISLVLLLVGMAVLLMVNARSVSDYFKENLQLSVILKQDVKDSKAEDLCRRLSEEPYIKSATLISREQGTEELKEMLGEDFLSVFETSPVPISIDVTLVAGYVSTDSIKVVTSKLMESPLVDEVNSQQSLIEALNSNLTKISMVMGVFIVLMLFISFVLINNTVRLDVFSRRFTVHTMKLVGATRAFIRAPYIRRAVIQGLLASSIATGIMVAGLVLIKKSFPTLFEIFSTGGLLTVLATIVLCGVLICAASTWFVVNRLVGLSKDELYG